MPVAAGALLRQNDRTFTILFSNTSVVILEGQPSERMEVVRYSTFLSMSDNTAQQINKLIHGPESFAWSKRLSKIEVYFAFSITPCLQNL